MHWPWSFVILQRAVCILMPPGVLLCVFTLKCRRELLKKHWWFTLSVAFKGFSGPVWCSRVCVCVCCRTDSLGGEDLSEAGREGDEDHGVRDPGQILQEHVTVQTAVHPLLCCGHTHTHTLTYNKGTRRMIQFEDTMCVVVCVCVSGQAVPHVLYTIKRTVHYNWNWQDEVGSSLRAQNAQKHTHRHTQNLRNPFELELVPQGSRSTSFSGS